MPQRNRPNADERFVNLIDDFNFWDQIVKDAERIRDDRRAKLRNIIKRRGRGSHNGAESSINAYDVTGVSLDGEEVRKRMPPKEFASCLKKSKYIQIDGGPVLKDPEPNLGPPEVRCDSAPCCTK